MSRASGRGGNPQCTRRRGDPAEGARRDVHWRQRLPEFRNPRF